MSERVGRWGGVRWGRLTDARHGWTEAGQRQRTEANSQRPPLPNPQFHASELVVVCDKKK